jgi:outer membrane receptor protein involved in Fe transport
MMVRRHAKNLLLLSSVSALSLAGLAAPAMAQDADGEEVIVTATRRSVDIQDVPLNIAAVSAQQIETLGVGDLSELAQWVPGLFVIDQGARSSNPVIVRGLNADPASSNDGANDGGGTVATYLGEIPLFVDLRLNDVERVEVLLGPQGTLYGAGTLGGAVRYIPNRAQFDAFTLDIRGDAYGYSEGSEISTDIGATVNLPLSRNFALRASVDWLNDTGFIDYDYVVQEPGVSNPDPAPGQEAANLAPVQDANTSEILSGRVALRWAPDNFFDATLSYAFQNAEYGGRTISGRRGLLQTDDYVSPLRVLEPNQRDNSLLALEMSLDVGWGTITSATGYSEYTEEGQRDQTDLLIGLEYSYESFPSFTAFTRETGDQSVFSQELRMVTDFDGPVNYILGLFHATTDFDGDSAEFTPGYDEFLTGGIDARPDNLEYYSVTRGSLSESALFGEMSIDFTDRLTVTGGLRWYGYDLQTESATDFPLLNTVFNGAGPDDIVLDFTPANQSDTGMLYKVNASYDWTDDLMTYFTVSQGYRIGNTNGLEPCVLPLGGQSVCGSEGELEYTADRTTNYEFGVRSQWFDRTLTLNGSIFYIDWSDPQVQSATAVGLQPIIINAAGARSRGFDLSADWRATDALSIRASYAYTEAELTEVAPRLIREIVPPGFQSTLNYIDGQPGDRLPGSPEHQANLFVSYSLPAMAGLEWDLNYGASYTGDVLTRTGGRGDNVTLPSYTLHNLSLTGETENWAVTFYVRNLLDEFVETNARGGPDFNQFVLDTNGDPHAVRTFYTDVLPPRTIGVRFTHSFGG